MSYRQASALCDRLAKGMNSRESDTRRRRERSKPTPEGVVRMRTHKQLGLIEELRIRAGFSRTELDGVVERATGVRGMAKLASRPDASKIVNVLWEIIRKAERKQRESTPCGTGACAMV